MPPKSTSGSNHLFSRLKQTPEDKLAEGVKRVEELRPESISKWQDALKEISDGHWRKCKNFLKTCLSVFLAIAMLSLLLTFLNYIYIIWNNPEKVATFLSSALEYLLVILSTLYIEKKVNKDKTP